MPELQPSEPVPPTGVPILPGAPGPVLEDPDYAFGCECADPALQIAQWGQEPRADAA
ncbi:MAG TPA: hypothetical protein VFM98_07225 [Ramlibacter sp.]|uniref:hypothetical protein n=1 Tax=Ramlibacter sp. TaxID=1917967 RepID=UPI002D7ED1A8|nr:hypothetical protein [Ramlibacter sp.]HET8745379.1 hypothetical protein [Ramlibacter sp.]